MLHNVKRAASLPTNGVPLRIDVRSLARALLSSALPRGRTCLPTWIHRYRLYVARGAHFTWPQHRHTRRS